MLYDCFVIAVTKIKNIGNFGASIGGIGLPCCGAKEICRILSKYLRNF